MVALVFPHRRQFGARGRRRHRPQEVQLRPVGETVNLASRMESHGGARHDPDHARHLRADEDASTASAGDGSRSGAGRIEAWHVIWEEAGVSARSTGSSCLAAQGRRVFDSDDGSTRRVRLATVQHQHGETNARRPIARQILRSARAQCLAAQAGLRPAAARNLRDPEMGPTSMNSQPGRIVSSVLRKAREAQACAEPRQTSTRRWRRR